MIRTYHTTDVNSASDIEQLVMLKPYGLHGTLLSRSLYEDKIDLRASIDLVNDRSRGGLDEPTYTEG
jgi:phosphoribosylformimino-5-aminoimidazole carboxamide ribonucleotide (ProFAR) isomerase